VSASFDARTLKAVLFDLDDTLHDETATFLIE
jgi:FMN phosphatase YigB (HAD superfamily)